MNLSEVEEDGLRELFNIGVGRAAAALSDLIAMRIELSVPHVGFSSLEELLQRSEADDAGSVVVAQDFLGPVSGRAALGFPGESGLQLARLLSGADVPLDEFDLEMSSILTEIGNIVLNGVLGSLANFLETNLSYTVPYFFGERDHSTLGFLTSSWALKPGSNLLIADAHFRVRQQGIQGWLLIFFDREVLTHVLQAVTVSGPASR